MFGHSAHGAPCGLLPWALRYWGAATQGDWHADRKGLCSCSLGGWLGATEEQRLTQCLGSGWHLPLRGGGQMWTQSREVAWSTLQTRGRGASGKSPAGQGERARWFGQPEYPPLGVAGLCELPVGQEGLGTFRGPWAWGLPVRVRGFLRRSGAPCEGQGQRWDAEGIHTGYARMFFDHKLELCGEEGPCSGSSWAAGDACNTEYSRGHC